MPVGAIEAANGGTRHQERLQHAFVDHRDGPRFDALIVVVVPAVQIHRADFAARGIEDHREEVRQDFCADALGERLALAFVFLAVAFDAVSEDLVEEHARRASGKNRRTDKRLGFGRPQQRRDVFGHPVDGCQHGFILGEPGRIHGFE